MRAAWVRESLV